MIDMSENTQGRFSLSRRRFLHGAATLAALAACTPTGLATAAGSEQTLLPEPLVITTDTLGNSLEPGLWQGMGMARLFEYVGAYLTQPSRSGQRHDPPEGGVAERWTVSPDGLRYTFTLRRGLTFHDGTVVDATAVVRSLTRQVNPADRSHAAGCDLHTNYTFNRRAIRALDPATVLIELERPDPAYLYRLFHPAAMILSPTALDQCNGGIQQRLVSCGPYQIERFVPNRAVTLLAFSSFWSGRPVLERITLQAGDVVGG